MVERYVFFLLITKIECEMHLSDRKEKECWKCLTDGKKRVFSKLIILFYSIKMDMKSANNILFRHILSLIKVYSKL